MATLGTEESGRNVVEYLAVVEGLLFRQLGSALEAIAFV